MFLIFALLVASQDEFMAKVQKLVSKGSYQQAIKVANDLIEEQGQIDADPLLFNLRGEAYFHLGNYEKAILDLTNYIYSTGTNPKELKKAYSHRGQCNLILGNIDDAAIDAQKSENKTLIQSIKSTKFQIESAETSEKNKVMKEALDHYTKVIRFAPMSAKYLVKALSCALELGNSTAFDQLSQRIFKIDAKNPMYLMLIGLDAFKKNELSLAQSRFKKCSSTNNKCMRLLKATKRLLEHRSSASRLIREKKYDEAAPHMSQCLSIVKDYASPDTNVSLSLDILNVKILLKKCKQNEALKTLDNLIKSYPNNTELRLDRGEILIELEDYDGAIVDLSVVSRKDPNNRRAQVGLKKASDLRDKERHQNYYDVLGVKKGCSEKELKDAFRKCVNKWHPDRYKDPMKKKEAEKKMKMINKAMDVLGDREKRKMYDAGYDPEAPPPPPDDGPQGGYQQQGGFPGGGQQYYQAPGGGQQQFFTNGQGGFGGADFSKIFQQMMAGQQGGQFFQQGGQRQQGGQKRRQQRRK